ncbi:MAG: hypothetical protein A2X35_00140 [Elusimicrobia bacterium GWA2_61_42]|nr:MAG: hypothetical protein A2X35_00140 [Elusimicrobia bacterium GWA2_61_42]OGR74507.1 MAG: hypothetical protein A2X38_07890 [Elusimicrobia bacterium GWC2_61_25]
MEGMKKFPGIFEEHGGFMKWTVNEWVAESYRARKVGALTAYIYRALKWPDFYTSGAPAYEVKYGGATIALIRFEGKGATVKSLEAAARFPEINDLDLVEIALWVSKLRGACSGLN